MGLLKQGQAQQLGEAGLDYYNHNLDTAPEFYEEIITTRQYQDRLNTLQEVRDAAAQALQTVAENRKPFNSVWGDWRPDVMWEIPPIPKDWEEV